MTLLTRFHHASAAVPLPMALQPPRRALLLSGLAWLLLGAALPAHADAPTAEADPASFVAFVLEDDANCLLREGQHVLVYSTHPKRTIRVWLDRVYSGVGTGDRSRSDLPPGADPEPLGCSRVMDGTQEWRVVRAIFLD
jgi:hypothetical protein